MNCKSSEEMKMSRGALLPRCSLCHRVPEQGIAGGIKLKRLFVCHECEWLILNVEIGSPGYEQLMKQIRSVFDF